MDSSHFLFIICLIFIGAVVFSTLAVLLRQSLLVAYITLGLFLGPYGAKLIPHGEMLANAGEVGIIFLLFLVGLDLDPRELWQSLRRVSLVTFGCSFGMAAVGMLAARLLNFSWNDSLLISAAMVFSSTVIGLKLMTKEDLFRSERGELMIGILLLQDLLAIFVLFLLESARSGGGLGWEDVLAATIGLPTLLLVTFLGRKLLIWPLTKYFWHVKEYVFLLSIAWCLSMAELGSYLGLSNGVGAFIAGVSIASNSRTAGLMRERLNPLKDFFLILFFFSIGAGFDYRAMQGVLLAGLLFCCLIVIVKPLLFYGLLRTQKVNKSDALEVGVRLGLASEFSLLICGLAADVAPRLITTRAEHTIEFMSLASFILSCYYVVLRYPTPMRSHEKES